MASRDPQRPNFVVIQTDDQGHWAMPHRNEDLIAPHLEALTAEGTEAENFYCASPVCSPARASLLTGRMPSAHGVHDWVRGEAYGRPDADGYLDGLTTTPEVLAGAGWDCGHSGKWHLGDSSTAPPGFSHWYAHRTGDGPYFGAPVWHAGEKRAEPGYITEAITDDALGFLGQRAASAAPFYLEVNYTAPHSPWVDQHPREYTEPYADCSFRSIPREPAHPWFSWEPGPVSDAMRDPVPSLIGYFAALTAVDAGVGRILGLLQDHALRESTCVIFTSDNGFSCGHHGIWGKGNGTWPLNMWEGSVKVPFIASMPGVIPQGRVISEPASACDLHPTILDLAGVAIPPDDLAAGHSLRQRLLGGPAPAAGSVFTFDEYGGTRMVRAGGWKYVTRAGTAPDELYNLDHDPHEQENRVDDPSLADLRADLHGVLRDWFTDHTDPRLNAFDRPVSGRGQLLPVRQGTRDEDIYYGGGDERRPHGK